jgi:hypothetical protein
MDNSKKIYVFVIVSAIIVFFLMGLKYIRDFNLSLIYADILALAISFLTLKRLFMDIPEIEEDESEETYNNDPIVKQAKRLEFIIWSLSILLWSFMFFYIKG